MSTVVEPVPACEPKPAAPADAVPAAEGATAVEPSVFRGDRFAVRFWFAGASILALLHVIEWLSFALRP